MRFAKWVFTLGGLFGLLMITPLFFLEKQMAQISGPISHAATPPMATAIEAIITPSFSTCDNRRRRSAPSAALMPMSRDRPATAAANTP